jgi:glycogen operon protein
MADESLLIFTRQLIALRKEHPIFCRRRWFQGRPIKGRGLEDIAWFQPEGSEMSDEHWGTDFAKSLAVFLNGQGIHTPGPYGEQIVDDSFYVIFNAHHEAIDYRLPVAKYGRQWREAINTDEAAVKKEAIFKAEDTIKVPGRSVILLQCIDRS